MLRELLLILRITRPFNAVTALLSFAVGYALYGDIYRYTPLVLGLFAVLLVHSATTLQNDIYDAEIDVDNGRKSILLNGSLSMKSAKNYVLYLTLLSAILMSLTPQKELGVAFVALMTVVAYAYNCPPLFLSRRPVASIIVLGFYYALIPLYFGMLMSYETLTTAYAVFGLAWMVQRLSISMLKDYKDVVGDKKHNKQTFLLVYGHKKTAVISVILSALSYIVLVGFLAIRAVDNGQAPVTPALVGLMAVASIINRSKLLKTQDNKILARVFVASFAFENYIGIGVLACLLLA